MNNFKEIGNFSSASRDNSLTAYRIGSLTDNTFEWVLSKYTNLTDQLTFERFGDIVSNNVSLSKIGLIVDKKGSYEIGVTKNGSVVGSIDVINNHKGIVNFASPIQFEAGDEINFKTIRNYASLGRVIVEPSLNYSGIMKFKTLAEYSTDVPDVFVFRLTMPSTFDNRNKMIFETGNTGSGVTFYYNAGRFYAYIGTYEGFDFDITDFFKAGKDYILLIELLNQGNEPIAKVYRGELINNNYPKVLSLIAQKKFNDTVDWMLTSSSGLGTVGDDNSYKGGLLRNVADETWDRFSEVFHQSNGHNGITNSYATFINPVEEQESFYQAESDTGSTAHYGLESSANTGILLDYSFIKPLFITGVRIVPRNPNNATLRSRSNSLFIRLFRGNNLIYTSPLYSDIFKNSSSISTGAIPGRVVAKPTLNYSGIRKFKTLEEYSSNVPDVFLFNLTMPDSFDDDNHIIFETGDSSSGVTFYHNKDKFVAFIGNYEGPDFDISNFFEASKNYLVLVELFKENNLPIAKVYREELIDNNYPSRFSLISEKRFNGDVNWLLTGSSGLGMVGDDDSFKGKASIQVANEKIANFQGSIEYFKFFSNKDKNNVWIDGTADTDVNRGNHTFSAVIADKIQLVSQKKDSGHIQFNYIEVQKLREEEFQMDNFDGSNLDFQFFSDKDKDAVWEDGMDKANPTKAVVKAIFR